MANSYNMTKSLMELVNEERENNSSLKTDSSQERFVSLNIQTPQK